MGCIYKITNTVNLKAYIGQTIRDAIKTRIQDHLSGAPVGSRLLKRAVKKYGKDAFTFEVLHDGIIPEFLDMLEIEAIVKFNTVAPNGYNLTTGGGRGWKPSQETRDKISKVHTGKKVSQETREKLSKAHTGKTLSQEHCDKMSKALTGRTLSQETRDKMSKARTGKKRSQETREKISKAKKGEKNPNYGKTPSQETREKLSKAHTHPDQKVVRQFYDSLHPEMPLTEKRRLVYQMVQQKELSPSRRTLRHWTRKWIKDI